MAIKWISRQFVDGYVKYPKRVNFHNVNNGDIFDTYDLEYIPGNMPIIGTNTNIYGHWDPIERSLSNYDVGSILSQISYVSSRMISIFLKLNEMADLSYSKVNSNINLMESRVNTKISALNVKITNMENSLSIYAPKVNPSFIGAQLNVSPEASNNSQIPATTKWIRDYVQSFDWPPKSITNLRVESGPMSYKLSWNDSKDFDYDNMSLSVWAGTNVRSSTNGYPLNETNGTEIASNNLRDFYNIYPLEIYNVKADIPVYIRAFPYGTNGKYNKSEKGNTISVIPNAKIDKLSYFDAYEGYSTVRISDKGILISGGEHGDGYLMNSIYILKTDGVISRYHSTNYARAYHGSARCTDDSVLMGGGLYGNYYDYSNIIEKITDDHVRTTLNNRLTAACTHLRAAQLGFNKTVFFGGVNDSRTQYVDMFDSNGNKTQLASLSNGELQLTSYAITGAGNLIIAGGLFVSGNKATNTNQVIMYNSDGVKINLSPLVKASYEMISSTLGDGSVIFGDAINSAYPQNTMDIIRYTIDGIKTSYPTASDRIFPALSGNSCGGSMDKNGNAVFFNDYGSYDTYKILSCKLNETIKKYEYGDESQWFRTISVETDPDGNVCSFVSDDYGSYAIKYRVV